MSKVVVFSQCGRVSCAGQENPEVILCLSSDELLVSGRQTIPGILTKVYKVSQGCDSAVWRYVVSYDEGFLVDPTAALTASEITGIFCKGCFTNWIEEEVAIAVESICGDTEKWGTEGNSGTVDGTNFVGTTDDVAFDVRVNNLRARRTIPDATAPIILDGKSDNTITGANSGSVISGGSGNDLVGTQVIGTSPLIGFSVIGGGSDNIITSCDYSVIEGGIANTIDASIVSPSDYPYQYTTSETCFIGGGSNNIITNVPSVIPETLFDFEGRTIVGGFTNVIQNSSWSTIGGGKYNVIDSSFTGTVSVTSDIVCKSGSNTISGGWANRIFGVPFNDSPVPNQLRNFANTVGGGQDNTIRGSYYGSIGGGLSNIIQCTKRDSVSGGGSSYLYRSSSVGGGESAIISDSNFATVAGGYFGVINTSDGSFIGGGNSNAIVNTLADVATRPLVNSIIGGTFNRLDGCFTSVIIGGVGLQLGSDSIGYQAGSTRSTNPNQVEVDVSAFSNIGFFDDIDIWIANSDGTARKAKFIEPNTDLDFSSANYSSFEAQAQANNIEYKLPSTLPTPGQVLTAQTVVGNVVTLHWA